MYTINYFISKFEKIPEEMWLIWDQGKWSAPACALGHCRESIKDFCGSDTEQGQALGFLFKENGILNPDPIYRFYGTHGVTAVNNGVHPQYQQPTPKQRILAALYDIKANQHVTAAKEIINRPKTVEISSLM